MFPIAAFPWKPESVKPYDYVPPMARIDPRATSDLDLATPLGRTVEASVLSIDETDRGEFEDVKGIDTGIILKVGRWRLLIESMEHTDEAFTPMDLIHHGTPTRSISTWSAGRFGVSVVRRASRRESAVAGALQCVA